MEHQREQEEKMAAGEESSLVGTEAKRAGEMIENREVVKKDEVDESDQENAPVTVCKFFLEGRCRFGEGCLNRHEGSPRVKPKERKTSKEEGRRKKKKVVEEKRRGKLPSMKTAADVISRLQWDKQMPVDKFTVGYVDRYFSQQIPVYNYS